MSTLTDQQARSLKTRDVSIALAAGAGCGKTFVLTERFLSHLDPTGPDAPEPAKLHELVAITFTDAAAREMRLRIRAKCYERLTNAHGAAEQDYWLRLLRAIDTARISTIHAFCTSLLRASAIDLGLDPTFGVLDQADADVLQAEIIDDLLREKLADRDERAFELAANYGLSRLKDQLRHLLRLRHDESFGKWLQASPDELVSAWRERYRAEASSLAASALVDCAPIDEIVGLLRSIEPTNDKFCQARSTLLETLPRLAAGRGTESDLDLACQLARVQGLCTSADWLADSFERYKKACEKLRNAIKNCRPKPFDETVASQAAELGLSLLSLAHDATQAYERRKQSQGKLDFDDQLAGAYKLLTDPRHAPVREQFAAGLKLLLVDEFQDTDQLQVDLVLALCGEGFDAGRLFFVGDFKQSIYRFRGAQPDVFRDLRSKVPESGRLPLTENFRSQPALLNFVNALFCDAFGDEYQPLRPHREQTTPEPAVEFLWSVTPEKNSRTKGTTEAARRQEARWIARRLRQLLDEGAPLVIDQEAAGGRPAARPLQLGDVAILFRALSDVQYYEEALREYELDYYLVGGHAFYSQQEIFDVLNLLRAVASSADEISLAGVLRSPFFSLVDETLFWLVEAAGSLNAALRSDRLPEELTREERSKVRFAGETIRCLREHKDRWPVASLINEALARTGYDAVLLAEFLGERKLANLHKLLERARAADHGGVLELDGFITQLSQFIAQEPKEALAATCPESANVIRLMTIHNAKGLEFPLVVVPDLDRRSGFQPPPAALDSALGPLVPLTEEEQKSATAGFDLYCAMEKRADAEERTRLLYVACTRAADYLILSSSLAGYEQLQSDWMRLVARRFDLASGEHRGTLPSDYQRPAVRVVDEEPAIDRAPTGKSRGIDLVKMLNRAHLEAEAGRGIVPREVTPVAVDHAARQQFSFSRLTGQLVRLDAPRGISQDSPDGDGAAFWIDPRGLGSLVHAVLQRADVRADSPIGPWYERLAEEHFIENPEAAAKAARELIERFIASARWRAMAEAAVVHRELEFLLAWPPGTATDGDGRYLQGYIDCLYQDRQGGWHIVDYKTNNVTAAACAQEARRYEMQLHVYAMAVERALRQPPVELVLHFLRPGAEHVVAWNDDSRRRGVEMVNQAMERVTSQL